MKKNIIMLTISLLISGVVSAQEHHVAKVTKETHVYSIKKSDTLRLDRYFTECSLDSEESRPVIIFMFGGAFYTGTRDEARYIPCFEYYAQRGYQVVSIDYRLALKDFNPETVKSLSVLASTIDNTINVAVEDLFDATSYLNDRSEEWNINPELFVTFGSSAGAISVLQAEYYVVNGHTLVDKLPTDFKYAGTMAMAGAIFSQHGKIEWSDRAAPILLLQGNADRNVPYDKVKIFRYGLWGSKQIAESLKKIESPYYFYTFDNAEHEIATTPMDKNRDDINAFLTKLVEGRENLEIIKEETNPTVPDKKKNFRMKDFIKANFPE